MPSPKVPALLAAAGARRPRGRVALRGRLLGPADAGLPLVLTVSRIAPQKDLGTLVEAAAALRPPCRWVVVGDGDPDLRRGLEERIRRTGAPVELVGARADAADLLRAADVFVLPSTWEARALVVQEAMAAGVPVVASDGGGLRDLVEGVGLLVPVGDAAGLAAAGRGACCSTRTCATGWPGRAGRAAAALPDGPARRGGVAALVRRRGRRARRALACATAGDDVELKPVVEQTKHIFVTGGVASSLGKGLTASSLGHLLRARGLRVTMQKLDPYLNVDPGTMNPFQHGEVFVTERRRRDRPRHRSLRALPGRQPWTARPT